MRGITLAIVTAFLCFALLFQSVPTVGAQSGQPLPDIDFSNYVGVYENPDSTCSVLFIENDTLMLQHGRHAKTEILPESSTVFPLKAFPAVKVVFKEDSEGNIIEYSLVGLRTTDPPSIRISKTLPRYTAVTLDSKIMNKYTGYYRGADGIIVRVLMQQNKLYVDSPQIDFDEILPESRTGFFSPGMFFKYSFVENSNGNVTQIIRKLGNSRATWENISEEIEGKTIGSVGSATLKSYAGKYRETSNCFLVFTTDGEHLFIPGTSKKNVELLPESQSTFFSLNDGVRFIFVKDSTGAVSHVIRKAGDSEATFVRAPIGGDYTNGNPIPSDIEISLVIDGLSGTTSLGSNEGASWVDGKLYFSDQFKGMFVFSDGTCKQIIEEFNTCGTAALPNGNLAVCDLKNRRVIEISPDGSLVKILADSNNGLPEGYPNDLTADAKGGVYVTVDDSSGKFEKSNVIIYITHAGEVRLLTEYKSIYFPNGLALSPDGTKLYISGTMPNIIVFDINKDGTLSNKRDFAKLCTFENKFGMENPRILADGIKTDSSGNLYVTTTSEGIQIFNKHGELIDIIPVIGISNCTFGGPDMSTLFITSGPNVLAVRTNTRGFPYPER